jgi:hypothetical protein
MATITGAAQKTGENAEAAANDSGKESPARFPSRGRFLLLSSTRMSPTLNDFAQSVPDGLLGLALEWVGNG